MMKSESLRGLRTMRQVRTSLNVARPRQGRTVNSLHKEKPEGDQEFSPDAKLEQILANEKMRATAFEASVAKSQQRMLKLRDKLAETIKRNEELTRLRQKIQKDRWESRLSSPPAHSGTKNEYDAVKLRY